MAQEIFHVGPVGDYVYNITATKDCRCLCLSQKPCNRQDVLAKAQRAPRKALSFVTAQVPLFVVPECLYRGPSVFYEPLDSR